MFVRLHRRKHAQDARHAFFSLFSMEAIEGPLMFEMDAKPLPLNIEFNAPNNSVLFFA